MLTIRVSTIPYNGLPVRGVLDLAQLNARTAEGDSMGIVWLTTPQVDLTVFPLHGGAIVKGTLSARFKQPCGRCGDDAEEAVTLAIDWALKLRETGSEAYDDAAVVTFEGDHVDLGPHLEEALILHLSPFWQPKRKPNGDCSYCGKCPTIGANERLGQRMTNLFAKAQGRSADK